ncbi:MAG: glycosyltransferase family 2 protein [Burkholderiales bacterium]|nr:glycosyltransferase family 2 protein [Burkholderiales bacterium]MDE1925909.1 glycosyltransferase family 2 protein [Burkholderiales bacterium]MDE2157426.1 glycosyltransferase family 2 protein [Burkholderiales bacterium]
MKDAHSAPLVGVVTVTYNSERLLPDFFDSCWSQTLVSHHVYAIDNASSDDSLGALHRESDPRLTVIANARNLGVAAGNNQGILRALADGCEWVLLLNNDTLFPPTLFQQLVDACTERDWKAVVPKMLFDTPRGVIWYGGGHFNSWRGHTGHHLGMGEPDRGQYDAPGPMDYAPTCCMLVHRSVFHAIGLMDETYFVYYDDTDFCWRMRQQHQSLGYWPAAQLVHKVGGSTGGVTSPFTVRITARNRLYYLRKHFGYWSPWLWLLVFLLYYAGRYLLRDWSPANFRASLEGSMAFTKMSPLVPPLPSGD